ncbi:MAG: hypothetical protein ACK4UN_14255, partial [Limisphaerales bacterium]
MLNTKMNLGSLFKRAKQLVPVLAIAGLSVTAAQAQSIIFDDFNVGLGRFGSAINASGTTIGLNAAESSNTRQTSPGVLEGAGMQRLVLTTNGTATVRLRHLSGGAAPANNASFTTTAEVDGRIGYYVKTTEAGWTTQINLDGPGNTAAEMRGSSPTAIPADGNWHLIEWDLDANVWGSVPGIVTHATGALPNGTYTIDSIYFMHTAAAGVPTTSTIYVDFVAKSASGSISALLPASQPCLNTPGVTVPYEGPIVAGQTEVKVTGVSASATSIKVYANSVLIGTKNSGIVAGTNFVTTSALVKGAVLSATQTVSGQEGCVVSVGPVVGGGPNSSLKFTLNVRENDTLTGPIGANSTATGPIKFLGADGLVAGGGTATATGAPNKGRVLQPTAAWQTISFTNGVDLAYQWAPSAAAASQVNGAFGILESLAITINDVTETGPYEIYIDEIKNGDTVIENFESYDVGAVGRMFAAPAASGTTSANLLTSPNVSEVSSVNAFEGTKALRVSWQFNTNNPTKWIRLTTASSAGVTSRANPQIDLSQPISFKILVLPAGQSTLLGPVISGVTGAGTSNVTVTWSAVNGTTYRLQYKNSLNDASWTDLPPVVASGSTASATDTTAGGNARFYRVV